MANICWMKRDIDNRARALKSSKGLLRRCKISWTSIHKRLRKRPEFLPTLTISFCLSQSIAHPLGLCGINVKSENAQNWKWVIVWQQQFRNLFLRVCRVCQTSFLLKLVLNISFARKIHMYYIYYRIVREVQTCIQVTYAHFTVNYKLKLFF